MHDSVYVILDELITDDDDFLDKDRDEQVKIIQDIAKERSAQINNSVTPTTEEIIINANQ